MAAILTLIDGQTALTAVYFNQLRDALANHLGITDDAAILLGRLVLPTGALEPDGASEGQLYYDTALGRPRFRHTAGFQDVRPVRQAIEATMASDTALDLPSPSTTLLSQAITTTGGDIIVVGHIDWTLTKATAAGAEFVGLRLQEDGVDIEADVDQRWYWAAGEVQQGNWVFFRIRQKPAGTYTYSLVGMRGSSSTSAAAFGGADNTSLMLIEV